MKCEPGKPEALDSRDWLAHGIGNGDAAIVTVPCEFETGPVDRVAEIGFTLLVEFYEWVGFEHAVDAESYDDFLGMVGIRCLIVNREISASGL